MTEIDIMIYITSLVFVGFIVTSTRKIAMACIATKHPEYSEEQVKQMFFIGNTIAIIIPVWNTMIAALFLCSIVRGIVKAAIRKQRHRRQK